MEKMQKTILVVAMITAFVVAGIFLPGTIGAGDLEPSDTPGPTMHTLEDIFKAVTPLPTGFVLWEANIRFAVCDNDGVVLDRATGLMWTKNANPDGSKNWQAAVDYCYSLKFSDRTDWRLPTLEELKTLTEPTPSTHHPALPEGHPFEVGAGYFTWCSTVIEGDPSDARFVDIHTGVVGRTNKNNNLAVWPVRGGN